MAVSGSPRMAGGCWNTSKEALSRTHAYTGMGIKGGEGERRRRGVSTFQYRKRMAFPDSPAKLPLRFPVSPADEAGSPQHHIQPPALPPQHNVDSPCRRTHLCAHLGRSEVFKEKTGSPGEAPCSEMCYVTLDKYPPCTPFSHL